MRKKSNLKWYVTLFPLLFFPRLLISYEYAYFEKCESQEEKIPTDTSKLFEEEFIIDTLLTVTQLDFKNADIRDVFNALAKAYNLNLWLDESVQGKVTLHLVNTSLNQVLEFILQQNNLVYEKSDNIVKISKAPPPLPEPLKITVSDNLLSVDLKDADLMEVVRILVQESNENIVIESGVSGKVSGTLKDIEFEKGLKALMMSNGFLVRKIEGVWHIDRLLTEQQCQDIKGFIQLLTRIIDFPLMSPMLTYLT